MYIYDIDENNIVTITGPNYAVTVANDPVTTLPFSYSCAQTYAENAILKLNEGQKVLERKLEKVITLKEFRKRFTFAEKVAIEDSLDSGIKVLEKDLNLAGSIDLSDEELIEDLSYYVSAKILTVKRFSEIIKIKDFTKDTLIKDKFNSLM